MNRYQIFRMTVVLTGLVTAGAAADVATRVSDLVPGLAAEDLARRHEARMELLRVAADATKPAAGDGEREKTEAALVRWAADASLPVASRVWVLRQLEYVGGEASVPMLAKLMKEGDAELRECARRALELNSSPSAVSALRDALRSCADKTMRAGLIRSLGIRRDAESVGLLAASLGEPALRSAAAQALGRIGTSDAVLALDTAYDGVDAQIGSALVEAAAVRMDVLERLIGGNHPPAVRAGALSAMVRLDSARTMDRVVAPMSDACPQVRMAALHAGQTFPVPALTDHLVKAWPSMTDEGRGLALNLMGEGGRSIAGQAARNPNPDVAAAAVQTLGRMGGIQSLSAVLEKAAEGSQVQPIAAVVLASLSGEGVEDALRRAAGTKGSSAIRVAAIAAMAERRHPESLPVILAAARDVDASVSRAAWAALRTAGGEMEIEPVARMVAEKGDADASAALKAMILRSKHRDGAAAILIVACGGAGTAGKVALMDVMSVVGGADAIREVAKAAGSDDADLRSGAVRALSNWVRFESVDRLLAVASALDSSPAHKTLAIRGIARLVASPAEVKPEIRIEAALAALAVAPTVNETKLLLPAIGSIANPRSLAVLEPLLADPKLSSEAAFALASLASAYRIPDRSISRKIVTILDAAKAPEEARKKAREAIK